jgi:hypothetical protein
LRRAEGASQWQRPSAWSSASMIDNPQLGTFAATPTPPGTLPSPHRCYRPRRRLGRRRPDAREGQRALLRSLGRGRLAPNQGPVVGGVDVVTPAHNESTQCPPLLVGDDEAIPIIDLRTRATFTGPWK